MSTHDHARPSSRRNFLIASTAGLAAASASSVVQTAIAAKPADPVLALVEAALAALKRHDAALDETFEAQDRYIHEQGGRPPVEGALLHRGEADIALSLHGSVMVSRDPSDDRKTFSADFVRFLRRSPRIRYGEKPHPSLPPPNAVQTKAPWPEAQARADEIVAAWDAREAETVRRQEAAGIPAADRVLADAKRASHDACRAAIQVQSTTMAGIEAKAAYIASMYDGLDDMSECLRGEASPQTDEAWGRSIVRDLLALSKRQGGEHGR